MHISAVNLIIKKIQGGNFMSIVDLHIHSLYSDGTDSVKELLERADRNNVSILSITDHNSLGVYDDLNQTEYNGKIIPGVELDCVEYGINFHILAYGFDLGNKEFRNFVSENNERLELVNIRLLEKMIKDHPNLSLDDYHDFECSKADGGWKMLYYLVERGLSDDIFDSFKYYSQYNHNYACVEFPSLDEVCDLIHKANGKAILAHPGKVIPYKTIDDFDNFIRKVMRHNLDGIECYYPSHSVDITNVCLRYCEENDLIITCGSDCHGRFENTEIGELEVTEEMVNLKGII